MTPILDDILPQLDGARIFTIIDVKDEYCILKLSEEASNLTMTSTPFGNIRWLRLPFGLKPSGDKFQYALKDALHGLQGIHVIADYILVVGKGLDDISAARDHDQNLTALLQRCTEKSIKLNKDKVKLRCKEVTYMGNVITPDVLKPDDKKIDAINKMQAPHDVKGVQRLIGMVNYLTRFVLNLSATLEPIRRLTQNGVTFQWGKEQHSAFDEIKRVLISDQVLKYYDANSDNLVLQCDACRSGLGAVLFQDDRPIGYGSRLLTTAEKKIRTDRAGITPSDI